MVVLRLLVAATVPVCAAAVGMSPAAAAAPVSAACTGQFFSSHAGVVPATDGAISVGSFVAPTAAELRSDFGGAISGASGADRSDCGL